MVNAIYLLVGVFYFGITITMVYVGYRGYTANPKRIENKLFLFLAISIIIWCAGESGFYFAEDIHLILGFYHFKYIGIIMSGPAFFLVANSIPIHRKILNYRALYIALGILIAVFQIINLTNPFTNFLFLYYEEEPTAPGKYSGMWSGLWWAYTAILYILILAGIVSLLLSIKQARTKIEKDQAKVLIFAAIIPLVGNAYNLYAQIKPDPTTVVMSISLALVGYALTKYKLLAISAEIEKVDGMPREMQVSIEPGYNYIVMDERSDNAYLLLRALATERPGLCVTGKAPTSIRTTYRFEKIPIIWITEVETEELSANPARLDFEIAQSIINFMRENPGSAVFIDDVEYLTVKCGFDAVANFLKDISDVASTTGTTFIVQIRPLYYEEGKRKRIIAMFDRTVNAPQLKIEPAGKRTVLYYRKEDTLEKIAGEIPAGEKVLVITRTHPKKLERYFKNAEYYWLTDMDFTDIKTIKPEAVDTEFIMAIKNAVKSGIKYVIIDGCDVVRIKIETEKFISFLKDITDLADKHRLNLFCVMEHPEQSEKPVIEARFDLVVS
jgi:hypothetical protein